MTQNYSARRFAITRELLTALSKATNEQKQAFAIFTNSFRMGRPFDYLPLAGVSTYERISLANDLNVVIRRNEDMHLLLWLGTLASSEQWAAVHKCEINKETGALQIYQVAASDSVTDAATPKAGIFDALSDGELLAIGLPKELLAEVRAVTSESSLEAIQKLIPENVYEALTWYMQGEEWLHIKEAYSEAYADETAVVPTSLGNLDTGRFHIVTSDEELRSIMDKPLAQWRVFLHPIQKSIVDKAWHGAALITGGAGTGKTVAAIHRARHLVRLPDWKESDKLLFTTFTKNLTLDIEQLLRQICTRDEMKRIQVQNIDAWLAAYIRQHGANKTIVYPNPKDKRTACHGTNTNPYEECWEAAWKFFSTQEKLGLSPVFYREEFEEVVLPQHCLTSRDYILANRTGRRKVLSRLQRKSIWPLFEEMRLQLQLKDAITVEDAALFAIQEITKSQPNGIYRAVIADEIQDFKPDMLKLLRAIATDVKKLDEPMEGDLFLSGDAHQRIYGKPVAFSSCGIEIRGRSKKLRLNYRTTDEIRKVADAIYEGTQIDNMDGDAEALTGYAALRHGAFPEAHLAKNFSEEINWICAQINALKDAGYSTQDMCVVVRTNDLTKTYAQALKAQGIAVHPISRNRPDNPDIEGVRIATMHRIKGLEFKVVFIAGMDLDIFSSPELTDDLQPNKACILLEKSLFYVASSRACDLLFLSTTNQKSKILDILKQKRHQTNQCKIS